MINIINLHKSFNGQKVLKGVNLQIKDGEIMVIIGRSGAGKSILLKHIIGLIKPDEGKIEIDGININNLKYDQLNKIRQNMSMVFQSNALFDFLNVEQNVGFFLREHTDLKEEEIKKRVREKLKIVGLEDAEEKEVAQLSGGMKKRVAIARALLTFPKIILYDEPTTGIDPIMANQIIILIKKLQKELNITSVIVTHDINSSLQVADRIAMLHDGKIIEVSTPQQIINSNNQIVREFISKGLYAQR